jgi:hypothetical protein
VSFGCGTTFDTRPFFGTKKVMTAAQKRRLWNEAREAAEQKEPLWYGKKGMARRDILIVQRAIGHPATGVYGRGTERAVSNFRRFWKIKDPDGKYPGKVNKKTWTMILFLVAAKYLGY